MAAGQSSYKKSPGRGKVKGRAQLSPSVQATSSAASVGAATPQVDNAEAPQPAAAAISNPQDLGYWQLPLPPRSLSNPDPLTTRMFSQPPLVLIGDLDVDELAVQCFGRELAPHEYGELVGAPAGAIVEVVADNGQIKISTTHPLYDGVQSREIYEWEGRALIYNESFSLRDDAPTGFGGRVFAQEVACAQRLGATAMLTYASGEAASRFNGYYSWAVMGYQAAIPDDVQARLRREAELGDVPADWAAVDTIQGLMLKGRAAHRWWRKNGHDFTGQFDLEPGSCSLYVLDEFVRRHGIVLADAQDDVGEQPLPDADRGFLVDDSEDDDSARDS